MAGSTASNEVAEKARNGSIAVAKKARNGSAMTMATIGMARVLGLIIDRREVGDVGAFAGHTDEELMQEAQERAKRLGLLDGDGPKVVKLVTNNGTGVVR
jgi:hypothetical protein